MCLSRRPALLICLAAVLVSGCMSTVPDNRVSRFLGIDGLPLLGEKPPEEAAADDSAEAKAEAQDSAPPPEATEVSPILTALSLRPTALAPDTPYATVAQAVLASDARVAEAELEVARLRAQAAERNWLPRIGPRVSLSSLTDFVIDLVVQQVVFDNGRKVAERDLAKADVELAAVKLVEDGNKRVFDALTLYLKAEENRALTRHYAEALREMKRFERVMLLRVRGGVSDRSDLNILHQKVADLEARHQAAHESLNVALAELETMAGRPLAGVHGLGGTLPLSAGEPLEVLRATAERDRALAEATMARAGHLPGVAVTASGGTSPTGVGMELRTDQMFGLGTMAEMKAIEAGRETAERRIAEAREQSQRAIAVQERQLDAYTRQTNEAATLTAQAKRNLDLFRRQYEAGQRQVMDVVGVYETYAAARQREIDLTYRAERAELELARLRGALADGSMI